MLVDNFLTGERAEGDIVGSGVGFGVGGKVGDNDGSGRSLGGKVGGSEVVGVGWIIRVREKEVAARGRDEMMNKNKEQVALKKISLMHLPGAWVQN
jgi:hypothetical protein